ncbi:hypothetical protein GOODEAATRI_011021 [Goodea atripinnis]|uniref:Uncharacterized protein n=1 Tax=Goodea atripinnis TaxID=208336 RepID=A0ABV0NTK2_9TELE
MEAFGEVNATQEELRFLPPPDSDPNNLGYHDYSPNIGIPPPVLPTGFEGVNFPEDPIRLLSVQEWDISLMSVFNGFDIIHRDMEHFAGQANRNFVRE